MGLPDASSDIGGVWSDSGRLAHTDGRAGMEMGDDGVMAPMVGMDIPIDSDGRLVSMLLSAARDDVGLPPAVATKWN